MTNGRFLNKTSHEKTIIISLHYNDWLQTNTSMILSLTIIFINRTVYIETTTTPMDRLVNIIRKWIQQMKTFDNNVRDWMIV